MSKQIEDVFDSLNEAETSRLLSELGEIKTGKAFSRRVLKRVLELEGKRPVKRLGRVRLTRRLLYAGAAAALLIALGAGTYAYAAEAKEYKAAKEFFMDNGLSTEGLTRTELKAVYRDITTESFTYDKTAVVLDRYLETNGVSGWGIVLEQDDPESISEAWERIKASGSDVCYRCDWKDSMSVEGDRWTVRHENGVISKLVREKAVWTYCSDKMRFTHGMTVKGGTLGFGNVPSDQSGVIIEGEYCPEYERAFRPAVTKLDDEGGFVWFCEWNNGLEEEETDTAVENEDGSITVFSHGWGPGGYYTNVTFIDAEGNRKGSVMNHVPDAQSYVEIKYAARFYNGYFVMLYKDGAFSAAEFDLEGNLNNEYRYSDGGREYLIVGIAVCNDRLLISAQSYSGGEEIMEMTESGVDMIPEEVFTPLIKADRTAVLLVCDTDGGVPKEFYSVEGAMAGTIAVAENDTVEWDIERILTAAYYDSSGFFSVRGSAKVLKLIFDAAGKLTDTIDNNETVFFFDG